ncbi:MAG: hypothetical protein LBD41_02350 [Clostridiales Family XIII bacterium]|jgi:hypothetical protein|nr:hypothetical protein [Clostridiales Family XIII bacterium]
MKDKKMGNLAKNSAGKFLVISVGLMVLFLCGYLLSLQKGYLKCDFYEYPNVKKFNINTVKNPNLEISFKFKQDGWHGEYDNIFQTAYGNSGIRIEMTPGGDAHNKEWALLLSGKCVKEENLTCIGLGTLPVIGEWNEIFIKINNTLKTLKVKVNSNVVFEGEIQKSEILLNNILIGAGFSEDRKFNGEIENFGVKYTKYQLTGLIFRFLLIQAIFLVVIIFVNRLKTKYVNKQDIVTILKWGFIFFVSVYVAQKVAPFTIIINALSREIIVWEMILFVLFFSYKFASYLRIKNVVESLFFFVVNCIYHLSYSPDVVY